MKNMGCFKANHSRCKCCVTIENAVRNFYSKATGEHFEIFTHLDCGSSDVIYLLKCP